MEVETQDVVRRRRCGQEIGLQVAGAFVASAVAALQADDSAHGWGSIPVQVLKFERDSTGVLVTLLPQDPTVPGGGALVRVEGKSRTASCILESEPASSVAKRILVDRPRYLLAA